MNQQGDTNLATWIQLGLRTTCNLIKKYPTMRYYTNKYTGGENTRKPILELDYITIAYTRRYVKDKNVMKHEYAVKKYFDELYPSQPDLGDNQQPADVIYEIQNNRRRNADIDPRKIELLNQTAKKKLYPISR